MVSQRVHKIQFRLLSSDVRHPGTEDSLDQVGKDINQSGKYVRDG